MGGVESPARHWRLRQTRYRLIGDQCLECKEVFFPPRDICPDCGAEAKDTYQFNGKGEVYSWTTVYDAPGGFEGQAPYTLAMVRLDEGPLVTAQLTDLGGERPEIGMPVEMTTRLLRSAGDERGMLVYGYKFRPII